MKIKKEYFDKVENALKMLGDKYRKLRVLKKEIAILKHKENYREINYEELGFKVQKSVKGIDDMVVTIEDAIYNKETEIEIIERKLEFYNIYLKELSEIEQKIIELVYFYSWDGKMPITKMARELKYDRTSLYNKKAIAINKIALMIYGDEALE
ncbi:hypothetical protein KWL62_017925 [Clostridioides difficile]|uniref:hypothetical protein n=1 Tax=Clostridioides difficile TaxID=1496 RepID=UPI00093F0B39|nr:hypothetical protein [Clostridioides difficile]EGT3801894.1 hypothetical protein [Clostridioides difficile]EGT4004152.1 hypothetical protein [Clostridioides difficile]MBY1342440.1 hypothetical protein [Clostridioides difficile]MBY2073061.1 hypothetical protein [Clostridioides difficile]MBZ1098962.1 hypothetical protein [Clostridioides difficile]